MRRAPFFYSDKINARAILIRMSYPLSVMGSKRFCAGTNANNYFSTSKKYRAMKNDGCYFWEILEESTEKFPYLITINNI